VFQYPGVQRSKLSKWQGRGFECNCLWVLKKSVFRKTGKISEIENVYPRCERRLKGFLTQSFSEHFSGSEFFNSHACPLGPVARENA
jgi:hypothetical protein